MTKNEIIEILEDYNCNEDEINVALKLLNNIINSFSNLNDDRY